jgi:hypothetical protein
MLLVIFSRSSVTLSKIINVYVQVKKIVIRRMLRQVQKTRILAVDTEAILVDRQGSNSISSQITLQHPQDTAT